MKKLTYVGALALGLLMTACKSDEPAVDNSTNLEGGKAFLSVNIKDVNDMGAFGKKTRTSADDFEFGDDAEHNVTSARFFFFDANGIYVTEANVWKGGQEVEPDDKNVEYLGNNVLVLKGIKDKNAVKYMITVLNASNLATPAVGTTMSDFTKQTFNSVRNEQGDFYMSTSSFIPETSTSTSPYNSQFYYANQLTEGNFAAVDDDAESVDLSKVSTVNVYVERLAAKVTMNMPKNVIELTLTVAGSDPNNNINPDGQAGVAATKLYVQFDNWDLSGVCDQTYLSKQFASSSENYFTDWSEPSRFRSYWGEAVGYGQEQNLIHKTYSQLNLKFTDAAYEKETTNSLEQILAGGKLKRSAVANALLTATVYSDADCSKPVDLVYYQGLYYIKDHYVNYVLSALKANGQLNFYKKVGETMTQVSAEDMTLVNQNALSDGYVVLSYNGGAADQLYALKSGAKGDKEEDYTAVSVAALNTALANFNTSAPAMAYTGGKMYYNIPVRHVVGAVEGAPIALGEYGLLRNHWYVITVGKVLNLGRGVFDPDNQKLVPGDDDNEKFGLAAQINILSWRLVNQSVDL